ncbi:DUF2570 family protein [Serratia sp. JSRIV001]|uniref:DUF2570 family protein n=1 Tax=unclassified Serratia (in: enterobacteria) TaxID=2647522 RepID=UPI001CC18D3B|nr:MULTISPECIES: DUF2570 family protein [unclassified Serratia (in: enterobacteria)]UAN48042.1 DUF2570 family protein [Serratia sp. JSRIV001]UAN53823.1 DUF2570 family protein [Serratia sp. JSRIV002]UAN65148.1 DUF2570 family protein [Serratia sp. JSRIV006]
MMDKFGTIGVLLLAICLGWYASLLSDDLEAAEKDNKALVAMVEGRDETIRALKGAADADRRANEEQLKTERQKRAKADAENRTLREALEHSDFGNQPLPDDVIDILRGKDATRTSP